MKHLILLTLSCLAMATASVKSRQADPCEDCKSGTESLFEYLQTPMEVTKQTDDLIKVACPEFENFGGCEVGVLDWWGELNKIYFSSPYSVSGVCTGMQACNGTTQAREWNCETCQSLISQVGDAMVLPESVDGTVELFNEDFCAAFDGEPQNACNIWVAEFTPVGMPVIANHIKKHKEESCNIVYDNVCMGGR
ncbi:hypothetical protein TCAL_11169 [Tigriopus californicus]|uniref:Saposin B-type domain-containing protein n=1 Tax=Tigriopus californicus TaxID=6832 RepID=A0A553NBG8_TIGCA|nr:uncharacterized protein LOC131888028 isoform X2 [Tigriopus californicus]TRY62780.1 hypothetical protein TCAL_11169 [Tigriopus californicus]